MSENSADSQVTSEAVLDRTTSLIILGAVLGSLFGITVLSIFYYFCINYINKDKKDKDQDSSSLYEERVNATTFTKNLGPSQTIALDMDGIFGWIDPQSKDNYEPSLASTPDMFECSPSRRADMSQCSPNRCAAESESISSSIRRVSVSSSVIPPPITKSVTPSGVFYSFSMETDGNELEGGDAEEASDGIVSNFIPRKIEDGPITEQVSMQSSPGYPRQVVTAASVYKPPKQTSMAASVDKPPKQTYMAASVDKPPKQTSMAASVDKQPKQTSMAASVDKQPKQTSMSRLVLERTMSYLRRNQVEGSLTSDTYFQSSFNNLPNHKGIQEEHTDQLNSSSERLKHILEKDDGLENELVEGEPIKCEDASDSVFLTEYDDTPAVKETRINDDNSSVVSPCTNDVPTDDSAASVGELLETANVSKNCQNETWSSSFSFKALTESPEGVSKELDWDCSHEPLQTRTSVLKLVCTPKPNKSKWSKDSPIKQNDALEDSIIDGLAHEILDELEWDDESQQGTKLTASFQISATHRPFSRAGKLSNMSGQSSNCSFTSATSVGRTPIFPRLHQTSCTDYSTAEEDISNNCETIDED